MFLAVHPGPQLVVVRQREVPYMFCEFVLSIQDAIWCLVYAGATNLRTMDRR